jgi:hypothetical protein
MTTQRWLLLARFQTVGEAELLVSALGKAGIGADLRGRHLVALEPEPAEVWVQERNAARANEVLVQWRTPTRDPETTCPACGEQVPAEFGRCWKCEAVIPQSENEALR